MCSVSVSVRPSGMSVRVSGPAVWLALIICVSVSALTPHDETFRYQMLVTRRAEDCVMCFGDECWSLQMDRCRYYSEVQEMLPEVAGAAGSKGDDVDDLVHDMVRQAAASWISQDCIPLVSQYTDCNKENICVGCLSCSCDAAGKWRCQQVQQCRPDPELDVDHRVLVAVAETLKEDKTSRKRRSVGNVNENVARKLSYADITEWMYGVKPDVEENTDGNQAAITKALTAGKLGKALDDDQELEFTTAKIGDTVADYIEFDEVLKNIAIDNQNYVRRKPQLNGSNYEFNDYMELDESVVIKNNHTDQFVNILNAIIDGNEDATADPTFTESSKVVIDLLAPLKGDENLNVSNYSNIDLSSNIIKDDNLADDANDTIKFDAINIMKRDLSSVSKLNLTTDLTKENDTNTTSVAKLRNNVLIPLTKIIYDKQQELKDLSKIKENLVHFIREYNETDSNLTTKSQEFINSTNTVLSIYNLDIFPEIQFDLRKINPNVLDKLMYKLKRDIYEVIRDVVGIKKISKTNKLPDDLGNLIRAMSIYVRKQGNGTNILQNGIKLNEDKNLRRKLNEDGFNLNSTKDYLITILEILDKDKPQTKALSSLSLTTRKVVKRVIKNHYKDDFSVIGLRVYDPEYNLTNDLRNVGNKWQLMTANIAASALTDKIYAMKLLYYTLSVDISKLNDALALIDFAHSRRMIPIEGRLGEELLDKINTGLRSIDDKIQTIIKFKTNSQTRTHVDLTIKPSKRKSFFNKIRNLLRGSKKDIVELVNKKVPRSEIVKTIAKKRLDEFAQKRITEYEDTMRKWQNTLNIIPRYKRSVHLSRIQNRMKNIIPKYLRGKLSPAIAAKTATKPQWKTQNEATLKRPTNSKQRRIVTSTMKIQRVTAKPKTKARNSKSNTNRRTQLVSTKTRPKNMVSKAKSSNSRWH